jgi:hypothetical protein
MKRKMSLLVASVCLIVALVFLVSDSSSQEVLDPLKLAPDTHKLVFENNFVRVIESRVPAGGQEPKHSHPHGLTVYLANYDSEVTTFPDGRVDNLGRPFGATLLHTK